MRMANNRTKSAPNKKSDSGSAIGVVGSKDKSSTAKSQVSDFADVIVTALNPAPDKKNVLAPDATNSVTHSPKSSEAV